MYIYARQYRQEGVTEGKAHQVNKVTTNLQQNDTRKEKKRAPETNI
jgi:hypothetical protein